MVIWLTGLSGSGKTTLLKCLNCLVKPTSGLLTHKYNRPFPMLFQKPIMFNNTIKYNYEILSKIKKTLPDKRWFDSFNLNKIHAYVSSKDCVFGSYAIAFLIKSNACVKFSFLSER